jgi:1,4-alpha-glucan branching enzyme
MGTRYWTTDFDSLNHRFGTADDLNALCNPLHQHGMYVIPDVVVNYMALPASNSTFSCSSHPFNTSLSFHTRRAVGGVSTSNSSRVVFCSTEGILLCQ